MHARSTRLRTRDDIKRDRFLFPHPRERDPKPRPRSTHARCGLAPWGWRRPHDDLTALHRSLPQRPKRATRRAYMEPRWARAQSVGACFEKEEKRRAETSEPARAPSNRAASLPATRAKLSTGAPCPAAVLALMKRTLRKRQGARCSQQNAGEAKRRPGTAPICLD